MNSLYERTGRALVGAILLASGLGACDSFIESTAVNPNQVPNAQLDQLFTTAQVNAFFFNEGDMSRLPAVWLQQLFGVERQFGSYQVYIINESVGDDPWDNLYRHGGLVDLRQAQSLAADRPVYRGILQIHEAFLVGMAAAVWGDLPYTEAVDPVQFPQPQLDGQLEIYGMLQSLLDDAIANLQQGGGAPQPGIDLNFKGDAAKWTKVAYSLKARYYMHVAEVQGQSAYQNALQAAAQGIQDPANNWVGVHTTSATENNVWFQFQRDRSGYIAPNPFFVSLLTQRGDARRDIYFDEVNAPGSEANEINIPATQDYNLPIVTCAETQFIRAEAALATGDAGVAAEAYRAGLACQEEKWGIDLEDRSGGLSGSALLSEIITEKYTALFLNPEIWNDYKRTCLPAVVPTGDIAGARQLPPGLFYPIGERQTNPNIPDADPTTLRNPNDPNPCAPVG